MEAINKRYPALHQSLAKIYHLQGNDERAREERRIWQKPTRQKRKREMNRTSPHQYR